MADYPHYYKKLHQYIGGDDSWIHKPSKINFIHTSPRFKDYDIEKISIDDLIRDNDLNNPVALNNHAELWSPTKDEDDIHPDQFQYKEELDTDPYDIIYGTRNADGTIRLANGRHRVRALKNMGKNYVTIPIHDAFVDSNGDLAKDYYSGNVQALRGWLKYLPYSEFSKEDRETIKNKIERKIAYLKMIEQFKGR